MAKNKWSDEQLAAAMDAVKVDKISIKCAAKKFGIPASTLSDHVKGKSTKRYGGPFTVLTRNEEQEIVVACQVLQQFGFPMTKQIVGKIVLNVLTLSTTILPGLTGGMAF